MVGMDLSSKGFRIPMSRCLKGGSVIIFAVVFMALCFRTGAPTLISPIVTAGGRIQWVLERVSIKRGIKMSCGRIRVVVVGLGAAVLWFVGCAFAFDCAMS